MSEKPKNMKHKTSQIVAMILIFLVAFFVGGYVGGSLMEYVLNLNGSENFSIVLTFLYFAIFILEIFIATYIQIIIHEAGHLVFGFFSGYKFASFQIGSILLKKSNGKFCFKKHSVAGMGGQCLMSPPDLKDGKMPVILYNLGGALLNLLTAAIFLPVAFLFNDIPILFMLFSFLALFGILFAFLNGVPVKFSLVPNDGYNALALRKNPRAIKSLYLQLKVAEAELNGVRLKDMPKEWFVLPDEDEMKNCLTVADAVFVCNRLMDEHRFAEAENLMHRLIDFDAAIAGIHKSLLTVDRIYCELIGERRIEIIEKMLNKNQKAFMGQMKKYPSVLRTEYAYALLVERNIEKANKIKATFEKLASAFAYPAEITAERELMKIAEKLSG